MIHLSYLPSFSKEFAEEVSRIFLWILKLGMEMPVTISAIKDYLMMGLEAMLREVDRTLNQILSRTYESSQGKEKSLN